MADSMRVTEGPWRQGVLLDTANTRRWSEQQRQEQRQFERRRIFANFHAVDEGRSRAIVAQCSTENDARLIASACNSYKSHFSNPITAAESDWIGKAVEVLREIIEQEGELPQQWFQPATMRKARALLARMEARA